MYRGNPTKGTHNDNDNDSINNANQNNYNKENSIDTDKVN